MDLKLPKRNDIKRIIDITEYNMESVYKNSALFYGMSKYKDKFIGTYYYYNLEEKHFAEIKVVFNKIDLTDPNYLFFKYKNTSFFNSKIKWKIVKIKSIIRRFSKHFFLYNNYKFSVAYVEKDLENVSNIDKLYMNHLNEIKKQFIALEFSKKYGLSYEWIIKNWGKFLKGQLKTCLFLK